MTSAIGGVKPRVHGQRCCNYQVTSRRTLLQEAIYNGAEGEGEGGGGGRGGGLAGGKVGADGSSNIGLNGGAERGGETPTTRSNADGGAGDAGDALGMERCIGMSAQPTSLATTL